MSKEGIPSSIKKGLVVGAALSAVPLHTADQAQTLGAGALSPNEIIKQEAFSTAQENPSAIVADHVLDKQIRFTEKDTQGAPVVASPESTATTLDTVKADIEQAFVVAPAPVAEKKASTLETTKVSIGKKEMEMSFKTIIDEAIVKARPAMINGKKNDKPITKVHSVDIEGKKNFLEYKVVLRAHSGIFFADITLKGNMIENGDSLVLTDPEITARKKAYEDSARVEVNNVFPKIMPTWYSTISNEYGGTVAKVSVENGGVKVELEAKN